LSSVKHVDAAVSICSRSRFEGINREIHNSLKKKFFTAKSISEG